MISPWLVVPCIAKRVHELDALLNAVRHPRDRTVVVTTTIDPIPESGRDEHVITLEWTGWHISRWWNAGIDFAAEAETRATWEVMIMSSDVTGSPDAVRFLATRLRELDVTMIGPDWFGLGPSGVLVMHESDHRDIVHRVPGACWMLAGESGLRCDERFRWWYTDDDLETQARRLKGVAVVSGSGLGPDVSNYMDQDKYEFSIEDRELYIAKWGRRPW